MSTPVTRTELRYLVLLLAAQEARRCGEVLVAAKIEDEAAALAEASRIREPSSEWFTSHGILRQFAGYLGAKDEETTCE